MVRLMRIIGRRATDRVRTSRVTKALHDTFNRTAAFSTQSSVYMWGTGTQGQLGHGPVVKSGIRNAYEQLTPKLVDEFEGKGICQLEFGTTHSAALNVHGQLFTWGSNEYNKLGLGPGTPEIEPVPQLVTAFDGIKLVDISCGEYTTAAVDEEGKLYTWGWGGSTLKGAGGLGHAGAEDEPTPRLVETLVSQGVPIARVECGEFHTVALSKDGELWIWGNGEYGRLGNGESTNSEVPEPVDYFANEDVTMIASGRDFTFALTKKGEMYGWGGNSHNQLGIGGGMTMDFYNIEAIPTLVEAFRGQEIVHIAAGYDHAAAVTSDGRMYMWGSKLWLEPHEMTILANEKIVQVACGRRYTVALSEDGKVFTFGKGNTNSLGHGDHKNQLQPLQVEALSKIKVTHISAGDHHMGVVSEPHANAMDRDFSLRQ